MNESIMQDILQDIFSRPSVSGSGSSQSRRRSYENDMTENKNVPEMESTASKPGPQQQQWLQNSYSFPNSQNLNTEVKAKGDVQKTRDINDIWHDVKMVCEDLKEKRERDKELVNGFKECFNQLMMKMFKDFDASLMTIRDNTDKRFDDKIVTLQATLDRIDKLEKELEESKGVLSVLFKQ